MEKKKIKIVLDADVLIHFSKADRLSMLPTILPEYEHIILDIVYQEIGSIQNQIDRQIAFLGNIQKEHFPQSNEMMREYAQLTHSFGRGESACMAYCRFCHDVIGSSNVRDITDYCTANGITYLTTLDFLYLAYVRKKMTAEECHEFMETVNAKGSHGVPVIDITTYHFNKVI